MRLVFDTRLNLFRQKGSLTYGSTPFVLLAVQLSLRMVARDIGGVNRQIVGSRQNVRLSGTAIYYNGGTFTRWIITICTRTADWSHWDER